MPVDNIMHATENAYMRDTYGNRQWRRAAEILYGRGLTDHEVIAVLNSKWPRWAADNAEEYSHTQAEELISFIDNPKNRFNLAELVDSQLKRLPAR